MSSFAVETASGPSLYLRAEGVPPVRIKGYPKRRRNAPEEHLDFSPRPVPAEARASVPARLSAVRDDVTYADFFAASEEHAAVASAITAA